MGGVEEFVSSYASWLGKKGIVPVVICRTLDYLRPVAVLSCMKTIDKRQISSRAYPIPFLIGLLPMFLFSMVATVETLRQHRKHRFSVVHAQDLTFAAISAILAGKIARIPTLIQGHSFPLRLRAHGIRLDWIFELALMKIVSMHCNKILVSNDAIRDHLLSMGVPKAKVVCLELGVDLYTFRGNSALRNRVRRQLGIDSSVTVIGFVGGFRREKNIDNLIKAYALLLEDISLPETKLILIGSGLLERDMKRLAATLNIEDRVLFLGFRNDVYHLLTAIDIFVLPSFYETFSLALVEAMAAGKAIVASNIQSIRKKVKNGYSALLINPRDVENIKETLRLLVRNADLREILAKNSKQKAQCYNLEEAFTKVLALYSSSKTEDIRQEMTKVFERDLQVETKRM